MKDLLLVVLLMSVSAAASAQSVTTVPFSSSSWTISGNDHEVVQYLGEEAVRLKGASAVLADLEFETGTIEFDVAFSDAQGFQGLRWSIQDDSNWEEFYLRSHLSNKPDANQYTPVMGGFASWQLYHGHGYSAPTVYSGGWTHVRVVLGEELGDVYVDSDTVTFTFKKKGDMGPGPLAVYASNFNTAYFTNFAYSEFGTVVGSAPEYDEMEVGTVMKWRVSDPFSAEETLSLEELPARNWQDLSAEEKGITNLARAAVGKQGQRILARVTLDVPQATVLPVRFGYSDRVRVFLNGKLLYGGDNTWRSRDYRFLGTIGLFDVVPLSLVAGQNELVFEVIESFGGWGIVAQFPETDGVRFGEGVLKD